MAKKDSFEDSLRALEKIVEKLEDGGLPLEEAIKLFQDGRQNAKRCAEKLGEIERTIQVLLEDEKGEPVLREFEPAPGDTADEDEPEEESEGEDDFPG